MYAAVAADEWAMREMRQDGEEMKLSLLPLKQWNAPLPLGHKEAGRWVKVVSVDELEAALACDAQPEGDYRKARGVLSVVGDSTSAEESIRRARGNTPAVRRPSREEIGDALTFNDHDQDEQIDAMLALFGAER